MNGHILLVVLLLLFIPLICNHLDGVAASRALIGLHGEFDSLADGATRAS